MPFLGLDIAALTANWCLADPRGQPMEDGRCHILGQDRPVKLRSFRDLLESLRPAAIGLEYTGRLADPWTHAAKELGIPAYIIHTTERKAINRVNRQRAKTDKRDARTIARVLAQWSDPERRADLALPADLFTDAESVRKAWQLRSMLATVDHLTSTRTSAKQRSQSAALSGHTDIAALWNSQADTKLPEQALAEALEFCRREFPEELAILLSIPGIGDRCATRALATLLPIERFVNYNKALAYVGLHATKHSSNGQDLQRPHMAGSGSKQLRSLLYTAAMSQTKANTIPGRLYRRLRERGKRGDTACVTVSAYYVRLIWTLLTRKEHYHDPDAPAQEPEPEPDPLPPGAMSQADYARKIGLTRQAVNARIKKGALRTIEANGRTYVIDEETDA